MARPTGINEHPPAAVEAALERLGRNIRIARLRRRMPQARLAERIGTSRFVVANIERGKANTSVAAYVGALWALGLLEQLHPVADPAADAEGVALERARVDVFPAACLTLLRLGDQPTPIAFRTSLKNKPVSAK